MVNIAPSDIVNGQAAALLGLVALLFGYWLPLGAWLVYALPTPRQDWNERTSLIAAMGMVSTNGSEDRRGCHRRDGGVHVSRASDGRVRGPANGYLLARHHPLGTEFPRSSLTRYPPESTRPIVSEVRGHENR